jgi:lysophospholipase L1-like esterase
LTALNIEGKKDILVYGDSYVFAKIPGGPRFDAKTRFTGVLQKELGLEYEIIEEGLRGRTVSGNNSFFPDRNGSEQFGPIFASHLPIQLLVLLVGTNDTNSGSDRSPEVIVSNFDQYLQQVKWWCEHLGFPEPQILLVAPPIIKEKESYKAFGDIFKGSQIRLEKLPQLYKDYAKDKGVHFLDSSSEIEVSDIDGIHLDESNNAKLGKLLAKKIFELKI